MRMATLLLKRFTAEGLPNKELTVSHKCSSCSHYREPNTCSVYQLMKAMTSRFKDTDVAVGWADGKDIVITKCSRSERLKT